MDPPCPVGLPFQLGSDTKPYPEQLEHSNRLQDPLVVLQQAALGNTRPGHDVVQHGLHHSFAHRHIQAPVHATPWAANETHSFTAAAR